MKDIWITSGVTNLNQHHGSNPPHQLELRDAKIPVIRTHLAASYNHAEVNVGYNADDPMLIDNPSTTKEEWWGFGANFVASHEMLIYMA
jgi:hypothetical protein